MEAIKLENHTYQDYLDIDKTTKEENNMQIEISVRDDKAKLFLEILKEFKSDMVEKFTILNNDSQKYQHDTNEEFNQSKKYFHRCLDDIENNNTTLLSQDEYKDSMKMYFKTSIYFLV